LGLTISRNLVELFGGNLETESTAGAGSVFSFTIPFIVANEDILDQYKLDHDGLLADDLFGLKILLAEDNEHNQLVAVDTLKKIIDETEITVVKNGNEVINLLKRKSEELRYQADGTLLNETTAPFDLILMDVQMPEMDGYETTRKIRNEFPSPVKDIPVIALTASVVRSDLKKCVEAGMNSYVIKPFNKEVLLKEIGKVIRQSDDAVSGKPGQRPRARDFAKEVSDGKMSNIAIQRMGVINLQSLYDLYGNNPAKLHEYFNQFFELVPKRLSLLKKAWEENDKEGIYQASHKLKPQLGFFGMKKEELIATSIEIKIKKDIPPKDLHPLIAQLEEGCNLAMEELKKELAHLSTRT
jgi:CheY-like chemotaxis protein